MFRAQNIHPKDSVGKNIKLFNCATEQKLCSGDLFYFETSDPEELPLPRFALLQMQWHLQRIAALSGAAEVSDEAVMMISAMPFTTSKCRINNLDVQPMGRIFHCKTLPLLIQGL